MKEKFEKPVMEKIKFEAEDIIVTSGEGCSGDVRCPENCKRVCHHCFEIGD